MKIGPLDVLAIVFIVLKLTGVIDWSWLVVLLPVIVGVSLGVGAGAERVRAKKEEK